MIFLSSSWDRPGNFQQLRKWVTWVSFCPRELELPNPILQICTPILLEIWTICAIDSGIQWIELTHRQAFDLLIHDTKPTKYTNLPLIHLCCNITLNTPTCCSPPGTIFRELNHSSTAYNQISHFIHSCRGVKESSSCNVVIPLYSSVQICWILIYSMSEAVLCC